MPPDNPDAMTELVPLALEALAKQEAKQVAEQSVQLSQHILGLEPFVLVQVTGAEEIDGEVEMTLGLEFGGGLDLETSIELLKLAIEELEKQVG